MNFKFPREVFQGVWSAMSTPLTDSGEVDIDALQKLVEHQLRLGIKGLFIAGTAGEGPWLTDKSRLLLARKTAEFAAGRLPVAMQITDNSSARMIDNVGRYADTGIDMMVLAPPFFQVGATQDYLLEEFTKVIDANPLPTGIYNRGRFSSVPIEAETLERMLEHPKVILVKDSASDPIYCEAILRARARRNGELSALYGNEFECVGVLRDGYDGLLFGGGCFNGAMANEIFRLAKAGKYEEAQKMQDRMAALMFRVFGGKSITCWLAGQKELMRRLGVFNSAKTLLAYRLTPECSREIDLAIAEEKSWLLPEK